MPNKKKTTKKVAKKVAKKSSGVSLVVNEVLSLVRYYVKVRKEESAKAELWKAVKVSSKPGSVTAVGEDGEVTFSVSKSRFDIAGPGSRIRHTQLSSVWEVQEYGDEVFTDKGIAAEMIQNSFKEAIFNALDELTGDHASLYQSKYAAKPSTAKPKSWWRTVFGGK
jgi:hypothetical protein